MKKVRKKLQKFLKLLKL